MEQQIRVGGRLRSFLLLNPELPEGVPPSAVLMVLHGSSQTGQAVRSYSGNSFDLLALHGPTVVVYPEGVNKLWNHNSAAPRAADDVAVMAALADLFRTLHGPVPVIIAGFSNGGQLLIRLIHEIPDKFDGAAIIGATLPRPGLAFADQRLPLPVMLVHGTHDLVVPYGGEGWFGRFIGRKRGPSAPETAQYFATRNNITSAPSHKVLPHRRESGRTSVTATSFEQEGRAPVRLYTVAGGGHVVPNRHRKAIFLAGRTTQDISIVEALAEFFPVLHWPLGESSN
ncbi:hypothetical protein ART_1944 [Arthrobacter sp. PAMC 25486]|uniref:alpha/beta hydrolase family esterase n=1 Tax=Arthrobacter sp. PAMC 25486 TaxID=1494608 RepID=UPI000535C19E|nr:PHB depolymerase family esterase [Arthrobacter sp. PAMC 25486]AIY01543.1 hypothetical protein ART_1944 [Arthrobacter sp. PAMC 25486]